MEADSSESDQIFGFTISNESTEQEEQLYNLSLSKIQTLAEMKEYHYSEYFYCSPLPI